MGSSADFLCELESHTPGVYERTKTSDEEQIIVTFRKIKCKLIVIMLTLIKITLVDNLLGNKNGCFFKLISKVRFNKKRRTTKASN